MATNHELALYVMTGCPYCIKVKRFLADNGVTIPERLSLIHISEPTRPY